VLSSGVPRCGEGIGVLAGISRAPLVRRLRELVARHPQFTMALGAGALLRLLTMIAYPGAIWFSGDSYVYVGSALRPGLANATGYWAFLRDVLPRPDLSKTTGYSMFLRLLLPFHSFTLVTGLQHLMGLGIGVMVYVLALRAGVPKLWATLATLPVLLDGFEIEDEHMVMAEALFTFLVMLALLLILWRYRTPWPTALVAGLLIGGAVDVRSEGLPLLILFPAFMIYRAIRLGWKKWRGWLAAIALGVGCLAPVAAYAGYFHHWYGSYNLTRSEGFYLWGRVSSFAECSVIKPPANELEICPTGSPSSRTAPGDYIWHAPQVHADLPGGPVSPANNSLLTNFAIRAVEAQPFGYAESVVKGLALVVEWPRHAYPDPGTVSYYNFPLKLQTLPANAAISKDTWIPGGTAYQDAVTYGRANPSTIVEPFAAVITLYQHVVYTWGPLLGLILLAGLGGVVRIEGLRQRQPRLTWARRSGSMMPWVTALALLVSPIAVADFDYRYLLPVLPLAGLAAGLAFAPARVRPAPGPARLVEQPADLPTEVRGPVG
jgi:hypothetical protein